MWGLVEEEKLITWYGQDVRELSREQLLEVVRHCMEQLEVEREGHRSSMRMFEMFRQARESLRSA